MAAPEACVDYGTAMFLCFASISWTCEESTETLRRFAVPLPADPDMCQLSQDIYGRCLLTDDTG